MGCEVGRVAFSERDYALFRARLAECLSLLGKVVGHPGFGAAPATLGAELEVFLFGSGGRPAPVNAAVCEALRDHRLTLEMTQSNLEANLTPVPVRGRPFTALAAQASHLLAQMTTLSLGGTGVRAVPIGTLPTLRPADLTARDLTDLPRYRALEYAWGRRRTTPFTVRLGERALAQAESVAVQGAACSWQVHLTVAPDLFCRTFNAAQLATGPALAAAGNSPFPFGQRGWQESRIPLYEQGFGDRSTPAPAQQRPRVGFGHTWQRGSPLAAFEEAVHHYDVLLPANSPADSDYRTPHGFPALEELRRHLGTVWWWNRPVYDPLGHLPIEFRALPSGPTPLDMAANTAFLVGLTLFLAADGRDVARELPFSCAQFKFSRAARDGLRASLWWPSPRSMQRRHAAGALIKELLPQAREGLRLAAVDADEADTLLDLLHHRVATGRTGAWWQQRTHEVLRQAGIDDGHGPTGRSAPPAERETTPGSRAGAAEGTARTRDRAVEEATRRPGCDADPRHLTELTLRYARLAEGATPVHTWKLPASQHGASDEPEPAPSRQ